MDSNCSKVRHHHTSASACSRIHVTHVRSETNFIVAIASYWIANTFYQKSGGGGAIEVKHISKKEGKDQESIQLSTILDPGKVTTSQLDITNDSQAVSPFPAGDHKASTNRRACKHKKQDRNNINDPQKSTALERSVNYFTGWLKPV